VTTLLEVHVYTRCLWWKREEANERCKRSIIMRWHEMMSSRGLEKKLLSKNSAPQQKEKWHSAKRHKEWCNKAQLHSDTLHIVVFLAHRAAVICWVHVIADDVILSHHYKCPWHEIHCAKQEILTKEKAQYVDLHIRVDCLVKKFKNFSISKVVNLN